MGFRKSTNNGDLQEAQTSALSNGIIGDPSFAGAAEYLPNGSSFSDLFQTNKGNKDPYMNTLPEHLNLGNGEIVLNKSETNGFRTNGDSHQQPVSTSEKKKTRNIGSKSKRLLMHSEDVLELRLTWEEAQDLLRPPPSANPSIVTIEDHEFEEYDEPPVFGKRTLFVSRPPGAQEQWAQCDDCSKWRRLPVDVLLPSKWSCSDNEWDSRRSSCSAPEEMSLKRLENLLRASKEFKKRRKTENHKAAMEHEPNGLDALASAAVLGDNMGESSIGVTTRHPRHRPGCTCIVCIQPPSGKGKHKPTCTCNVCMTVKRRFKTLMLRKKKRQSEREADSMPPKDDDTTPLRKDGPPKPNGVPREEASLPTNHPAEHNEAGPSRVQADHVAETSSAGQIDLNSHPSREYMQMEPEGPVGPDLNPMNLGNKASSEMRSYTKQNGINSLILYDLQQAGHDPHLPEQANGEEGRDRPSEGLATALVVWERDNRIDAVFGD